MYMNVSVRNYSILFSTIALLLSCSKFSSGPTDDQIVQDAISFLQTNRCKQAGDIWQNWRKDRPFVVNGVNISGRSIDAKSAQIAATVQAQRNPAYHGGGGGWFGLCPGIIQGADSIVMTYTLYDTGWKFGTMKGADKK